jgi:hypothetical protein
MTARRVRTSIERAVPRFAVDATLERKNVKVPDPTGPVSFFLSSA